MRKGFLVIALGFFLLLLTHILTAFLCGGIASGYTSLLYWRRPRLVFVFGFAAALGVGGAAFYWVPLLTLAQYTHLGLRFVGHYDYHRWFLDSLYFRMNQRRVF